MALRRKRLKLDQDKLDRARRLLGVSTEQEAVETALDLLLGEDAILAADRKARGAGGFVDAFLDRHPVARRKRAS
jgi:hypothetical protein